MTSIKEALETARTAIWTGGDTVSAIAGIDAALAQLDSADANPAWNARTHDEIIKRLMSQVGMPNSMSLYQAFKQFANELHALSTGLLPDASPGNGAEAKGAFEQWFTNEYPNEKPQPWWLKSHLQKAWNAALHSTSAVGETTSSDGLELVQAGTASEAPGSTTGGLPRSNAQVDARPSEAIHADVLAMKEACKRVALDAFREQCGCEKHCDSWPASRGFCQCANIEADITRAIDKLSPDVKAPPDWKQDQSETTRIKPKDPK